MTKYYPIIIIILTCRKHGNSTSIVTVTKTEMHTGRARSDYGAKKKYLYVRYKWTAFNAQNTTQNKLLSNVHLSTTRTKQKNKKIQTKDRRASVRCTRFAYFSLNYLDLLSSRLGTEILNVYKPRLRSSFKGKSVSLSFPTKCKSFFMESGYTKAKEAVQCSRKEIVVLVSNISISAWRPTYAPENTKIFIEAFENMLKIEIR